MATNIFSKRVDNQTGLGLFGFKKIRRSHGVIHHVKQSALGANFTYALKISDLRAWVRDGFDENQASIWLNGVDHVLRIGRIHITQLATQRVQGPEQAVRIAEEK